MNNKMQPSKMFPFDRFNLKFPNFTVVFWNHQKHGAPRPDNFRIVSFTEFSLLATCPGSKFFEEFFDSTPCLSACRDETGACDELVAFEAFIEFSRLKSSCKNSETLCNARMNECTSTKHVTNNMQPD